MTLQYLGTARLDATPRLDHIDTPEQPQPVYTDLDALIADEMALRIKDGIPKYSRRWHESQEAERAAGAALLSEIGVSTKGQR